MNCHKVCVVIQKKLSCGGEPVARCAQGKFRLSVKEKCFKDKTVEVKNIFTTKSGESPSIEKSLLKILQINE